MSSEFGIALTGIKTANIASDNLATDRQKFATTKKKSHEQRSRLALDIQKSKHDLDEAVRHNRARFKVIKGDKP